jgi:hypothetical protein
VPTLTHTRAYSVLDACIATEQAQINGCANNDYSCLCQQYGNLLTCYNNCPNDPNVYSVQQQKTQQCSAAQAYGTTTLMVAKSTATSAATSLVDSSAVASATSTETATGSAASSTSSKAAAGALRVETAGSLLAVVAAGFGVFM